MYLHYTGPIFVIGSWLNRVDKTPDGDWFQIATFCKWGEEYDIIGWKDTSASPSIKQYRSCRLDEWRKDPLTLSDPPLGLYGLLLCFLRFLTVEKAASHWLELKLSKWKAAVKWTSGEGTLWLSDSFMQLENLRTGNHSPLSFERLSASRRRADHAIRCNKGQKVEGHLRGSRKTQEILSSWFVEFSGFGRFGTVLGIILYGGGKIKFGRRWCRAGARFCARSSSLQQGVQFSTQDMGGGWGWLGGVCSRCRAMSTSNALTLYASSTYSMVVAVKSS